ASSSRAAGAAGLTPTAGIPMIVGVDDLALRITRPFDHNSSVWQPSQRTTACAGPLTTDGGSALLQLGQACRSLTAYLRAPSSRAPPRLRRPSPAPPARTSWPAAASPPRPDPRRPPPPDPAS